MAVRIPGRVEIPEWVRDHESFRRWARSPEFPEKLGVAFYDGDLWMDLAMEQLYTQNQVKLQVGVVLTPLVEEAIGRYIADGMLLSLPEIGLSTNPDGYLVTYESLRSGRVREVAGLDNGCIEIEGGPDMVLEVVSKSSEQKDLVDLPDQYWRAGVREYWVIDARAAEARFDLLRRGAESFGPTRRQSGGWLKSAVFSRCFRLTSRPDPLGKPMYSLEVK